MQHEKEEEEECDKVLMAGDRRGCSNSDAGSLFPKRRRLETEDSSNASLWM